LDLFGPLGIIADDLLIGFLGFRQSQLLIAHADVQERFGGGLAVTRKSLQDILVYRYGLLKVPAHLFFVKGGLVEALGALLAGCR
jgi:hypothetical protein